MITINSISINEFRGIKKLELNFNNSNNPNFAICGPNGTGKSGVIDAIEFALTGNISRLTGKGSQELSVLKHAPHVDSKDSPENSYVELSFKVAESDEVYQIKRSVKNNKKATVKPNNKESGGILNYFSEHSEFALSRREIIKYIMVEPGKRAEEVQSLLKLEKLTNIRKLLQKISNKYDKEEKFLLQDKNSKRSSLILSLGIEELSEETLIEKINERRKILSLSEIKELKGDTSVKDGVLNSDTKQIIPKNQAISEIEKLNSLFLDLSKEKFLAKTADTLSLLRNLNKDSVSLSKLNQESLIRNSLETFDGKSCPVCETEWNEDDFKELLNTKLENFQNVQIQKGNIESKIKPILDSLSPIVLLIQQIQEYNAKLPTKINVSELESFQNNISTTLLRFQEIQPLEDLITKIEEYKGVPEKAQQSVRDILAKIKEISNISEQQSAREFLILVQERLDLYRSASKKHSLAKKRSKISREVFEKYDKITNDKLEAIYNSVEKSFRDLYRAINKEDESNFDAKLEPSSGKLGFNVDFYGRGLFPPGAYHSEGHQDGMGLCLYLALMKHLLGKNFTIAVLDDVLMSVDSGHRREVCSLLKQHFPKTQFILTTHDDIWLKHMNTAGLIDKNNFMHFRTWSPDQGPTEWNDRNVWEEITVLVDKNNIRESAALLRNYLEYISKEICHRLKAQVPFRGDAQYTLSDLLPNGVKRLKKLINEGVNSAKSWSKEQELSNINEFKYFFETAASESNVENWQVNSAIHSNEWATFHINDFRPVVESYKKLVSGFECKDCNGLLYLNTENGKKQSLRCDCAATNINLVKK